MEGPEKILGFIIVLTIMSYSILKRLPPKGLFKISRYNLYASLLIVSIVTHGLVFGVVQIRDLAVLITYWIWFILTITYFRDKTLDTSLKFILISFLIFNIANYVYFKMYFADQKQGFNSILALFGIVDYRIYFPLSSGANIFTSQLALNAILTLYFIKNSIRKYPYFLIYVFYIYMLILADSRQILLLTLVFSVIYWFSLKRILSFLRQTWWVIGIGVFLFLYVFYNTNIFDNFKRPGELKGVALSRIEIWGIASDVIFDGLHFLTGHGLNGFENNLPQSSAGVFENQNLQTSHNFIIQNVIDFGVIGISLILILLFKIFKLVLKLNHSIITIMIIMLLLIGFTESIPTLYSFEPTLFFIAVLTLILIQNERKFARYT